MDVSFSSHARSAGGIDAIEAAVRPVWTCRCKTLERAATSSLSSRMEAVDSNAHEPRRRLTATEAAIPIPIVRTTLPSLSGEVSASRDHKVTEPWVSSAASLSEPRATIRSIGRPSAARSCRAASTSVRAAMRIRTSTTAASPAPASAANPYTTPLAGHGDRRSIWLRMTPERNFRACAGTVMRRITTLSAGNSRTTKRLCAARDTSAETSAPGGKVATMFPASASRSIASRAGSACRTTTCPFSRVTTSERSSRRLSHQARYNAARISIHRLKTAPIRMTLPLRFRTIPLKEPGGWHRGPNKYAIRLAILRQDNDHRPGGDGIAVRELGHELYRRNALRLDRQILPRRSDRPHQPIDIRRNAAALPEERVNLTFLNSGKCRDDAPRRGERIYGFAAEHSGQRFNGGQPLRRHAGNELKLPHVGKRLARSGRHGPAIGRTKRSIGTRRIAGIAPFNDTHGDIVRRHFRSTDGAQ